MRWARQLRSVLSKHVLLVDGFIAAVVGAVTLLVPHPDALPGQGVPLPAAVAGGLSCLALAGRRRWPRASLAAVLLATGAAVVLAGDAPIFMMAGAIAMYTAAVHTDRRTTIRGFLAAAVVLITAVTLVRGDQDTKFVVDTALGVLGWTAVAAAVGDSVRTRRAYLAATEERANRAERTREDEARRRVVEERLRIARDLHDVVAHNVAVVSVQAGLADHLFTKDPGAARQALHQVQRASASILDELSGILGVLRHPDDGQPVGPAPGLGQINELVDFYVDDGLDVEVSTSGQPHALAGNTDVVAYRVAQEALTNAHKHGGAPSARIGLTYSAGDVVLEVANPLGARRGHSKGTGHGITGMRERAAAVGGDLQVTPDADGEFRVRLTLPARPARP